MWQRFTEKARKIIFYAQEEAQGHGDGYVSTEHILLGLLREPDSTAGRTLELLQKNPHEIREAVILQLPKADTRPSQDMTLTPRAKQVIDLAYDETRMLRNDYIGTEHLLLGLIHERESIAARVLKKMGVDLEATREAVATIQTNNPEEFAVRNASKSSSEFQYRTTMNRVREWVTWAAHLEDPHASLSDDLKQLQAKLAEATSDMERSLLLGLCLEISEGGSLADSENWKKLRLSKEQVEALAQIGAEVKKVLE